jgi:hypothetical protein
MSEASGVETSVHDSPCIAKTTDSLKGSRWRRPIELRSTIGSECLYGGIRNVTVATRRRLNREVLTLGHTFASHASSWSAGIGRSLSSSPIAALAMFIRFASEVPIAAFFGIPRDNRRIHHSTRASRRVLHLIVVTSPNFTFDANS